MSRKKPNPFADIPGDLLRAVAADPVPRPKYCPPCGTSHPADYRCPHAQAGRVAAPSTGSPVAGRRKRPRVEQLRAVLGTLQQALAYSGATDRERCEREELLRAAAAMLQAELPPYPRPQDSYAARVAAQTARIDAHLNEEGRRQRKRKR